MRTLRWDIRLIIVCCIVFCVVSCEGYFIITVILNNFLIKVKFRPFRKTIKCRKGRRWNGEKCELAEIRTTTLTPCRKGFERFSDQS